MQHEMNIKNTLDQIGCPASVFCYLSGIAESRWSRAIRGVLPLTGPESEKLTKIVAELTSLVRDAEPYVLSFRNPERIRTLLERKRQGLILLLVPLGPEHLREQFEAEEKKA